MSTEIDELVHRFIRDITDIVQRVRHASRMATLRALGPLSPEQQPSNRGAEEQRKKVASAVAPKKVAQPSPARRRAAPLRSPVPKSPAARAATAKPHAHANGRGVVKSHAPAAAPTRSRPEPRARVRGLHELADRVKPIQTWSGSDTLLGTNGAASASEPPPAEQALPTGGPEREAAVLEAVRFLVRATAGEIVERTGLPNNAVYLVLRSLVAAGRVAKSESARGAEYCLVSMGSIRPFKRQSTARSESEAPPPPPPSPEAGEVVEAVSPPPSPPAAAANPEPAAS